MNTKIIAYQKARSIKYLFYRQHWHILSILILMGIARISVSGEIETGKWLGINSSIWFRLSIIIPVLHQLIVWLAFRLQLGWATFTKIFREKDLFIWGIIFFPFLIARPITILGLARASQNTLSVSQSFANIVAVIFLIPALYTLWSVYKYFGLKRALGGDHFRVKYRVMPLVKEGAFKYSQNAMYKYGFLLLYSFALFNKSYPALISAIYQHLIIWFHYYCTEKPDLELIYKLD